MILLMVKYLLKMWLNLKLVPTLFLHICVTLQKFTGITVPVDELVSDCKIQGESFKVTVNVGYDCLDASCDVTKYDQHISNLSSNPEMQELVDSMGAECTFSGAYHTRLNAVMVAFFLTIFTALFA